MPWEDLLREVHCLLTLPWGRSLQIRQFCHTVFRNLLAVTALLSLPAHSTHIVLSHCCLASIPILKLRTGRNAWFGFGTSDLQLEPVPKNGPAGPSNPSLSSLGCKSLERGGDKAATQRPLPQLPVHGRNPAPPKNPWNHATPLQIPTNVVVSTMASKLREMDFVHPL